MPARSRQPLALPASTLPDLRAQAEGLLCYYGASPGDPWDEAGLDPHDFAAFLLAALGHLGARQVPAEGGAELLRLQRALSDALPAEAAPGWDQALAALGAVFSLAAGEPRGEAREPRCFPLSLSYPRPAEPGAIGALADNVFGVVAPEGWLDDRQARDEIFGRLLGNHEAHAFVEISAREAQELAQRLLAREAKGRAREAARAAEAVVRLLGEGGRRFAYAGYEAGEGGVSWSVYGEDGRGAWGRTSALLVTDGRRLVRLEEVWGVEVEP